MEREQKTFLIVNLACFGDVLLTNPVCRNLKAEYPDCKIVYLVNKPYIDAAKYQQDVDDVVFMNKRNEHKGLFGLIKFAFNCKYKNKIDASFIVYGNPRGIIVSKLLGAKKIVAVPPSFIKFLVTNIPTENKNIIKAQDINGHLFEGLNNKQEQILPIRYITSPSDSFITQKIADNFKNQEIIGLCCVSKNKVKDMPTDTAIELINKLHSHNKIILLLGSGAKAREYADNLKKRGCFNFVDLTNITTIYDLANILKICSSLISVDTGTMHLGYAVEVPTVCVFYQKNTAKKWAPEENLYNVKIVENPVTAEKILINMNHLCANK